MTQQEATPAVGSCDSLLTDYFKWGSQQDLQNGKALVDCSVTFFLSGDPIGIYSGTLEFTPGKVELDFVVASSFSGELTRHYSPRSESASAHHQSGENGSGTAQHIPHRIHIAIAGGSGPVMHLSSPSVTMSVEGQGVSTKAGFEPQCLAGNIYGVGNALRIDHGPIDPMFLMEALYVVGLRNQHYVANA